MKFSRKRRKESLKQCVGEAEREEAEAKVRRKRRRVKGSGKGSVQFSGNDEGRKGNRISGGNSEREPPVPIPNTEVKPLSAEGTWLETARENRTLPDSKRLRRKSNLRNPFFVRKKQAKRCGGGRRHLRARERRR